MYKRVILIFMVLVIIFSISVPFASAADSETKSVQYYKYGSTVLPDINEIWDKDKYPYVVIIRDLLDYKIYFLDKSVYQNAGGPSICTNAVEESAYCCATLNGVKESEFILRGEVQWSVADPIVGINKSLGLTSRLVWSNQDIYFGDSTTNLVYTSFEPVIDKLVEYSTDVTPAAPLYDYGGVVLPNIETFEPYDLANYPYALIYKSTTSYVLRLSDVPMFVSPKSSSSPSIRLPAGGTYVSSTKHYVGLMNGTEWGTATPIFKESTSFMTSFSYLVWANYDLCFEDGSIAYTSTPAFAVEPPDVGGGDSGGGGNVEVADITFFNNILRLFTSTFDAASGDEYFRFLIYFVAVEVAFGLFFFLTKGSRKL